MRHTLTAIAGLLALTAIGGTARAEVITTLDDGDDWTLVRSDTTTENRILVKNSAGEVGTDRIGVAQFSGYAFSDPVMQASVRFDIERTAAGNNFDALESIQLWGVPDGATGEDIVQTDAYSTVSYVTDDLTDNLVDDAALVFLGQVAFPVGSSGDVVDFFGPAVTAFVQADSNNLMTFLLTAVGDTDSADTVLFYNEDASPIATEFYPSVMTNADAIVPEPTTFALLGLTGMVGIALRRIR
ncbi:hypothetical protein Pla123a_49110 [Posidoniimonas polymericola]|uniref:Ice-binding protein C-terminal domain-containing protein n=1 Tax=Posidoniimonas polymericola TaxID=2528002 RepID=A0A5C5XSY6_9BACT|nr:PEP-CTERM sorting domain-containing protein [Posidoniimonas polymericola]TWT65443.1 hypothetical protein Pla123a_49110 [Posidoniimonas polymericola]